MPSWVKLVYGIRDIRDSFRTQPQSFEKKKNYVLKSNIGRGTFGRVLVSATFHTPFLALFC